MELSAKLVQVLPLQTGTGRNGEWRKQEIIVETGGQYPKKVCVSIWGDKINDSILKVGAMLNISFDVESREYNGRWYTDVKAWKVASAGGADSGGGNTTSYSDEMPPDVNYNENNDDLPF